MSAYQNNQRTLANKAPGANAEAVAMETVITAAVNFIVNSGFVEFRKELFEKRICVLMRELSEMYLPPNAEQ